MRGLSRGSDVSPLKIDDMCRWGWHAPGQYKLSPPPPPQSLATDHPALPISAIVCDLPTYSVQRYIDVRLYSAGHILPRNVYSSLYLSTAGCPISHRTRGLPPEYLPANPSTDLGDPYVGCPFTSLVQVYRHLRYWAKGVRTELDGGWRGASKTHTQRVTDNLKQGHMAD